MYEEPVSSEEYQGSQDYIASPELLSAVNAAIALKRPLLIKGEPGTGKTLLARSIAEALGKDFLSWNIKSTTKAVDGLYHYDVVQRLNDARFGDKEVTDIKQYIVLGQMGRAFRAASQVVLLIDEIDKADVEFPNDLLQELDAMEFTIPETRETITALQRPIVIITSNSEKDLPDAFLRRCLFHYIAFPGKGLMEEIVRVHFPKLEAGFIDAVLRKFYWLRGFEELRKPPSTSELLDWIYVLLHGGMDPQKIIQEIPFLGILLKNESDINLVGNGRRR